MLNKRGPRESSSDAREKHRINEQITAHEVRLIGAEGNQVGVISTREALRIAEDDGLDLVEVAPEASPPVCRILDYGKLKYREQKKAAEARKRGTTHVVKEIRVRYSTDTHDLETKVRAARKFLLAGDRVRFQMRFRGREAAYKELGVEIFKQIEEMLKEVGVVDESTPLMGQKMMVTFVPKGATSAKA
jgi:translation initiation factor IF-3